MRFGDTRVFSAAEHHKARVKLLIDNSSSTNGSIVRAIWDIAAAVSALFDDVDIFTYSRHKGVIQIGIVEPGNKLAGTYADGRPEKLVVVGPEIASQGTTPDAEALLYLENEAKSVSDVVLVHICDGEPDEADITRMVANQLYESGIRYATIIVGDAQISTDIYPTDARVQVSSYMQDGDWRQIESLLSYIVEA